MAANTFVSPEELCPFLHELISYRCLAEKANASAEISLAPRFAHIGPLAYFV
jgi:hypothetical protein